MRQRAIYSAYAGLGRSAMWHGFPMVPTLIVLCTSVLTALAAMVAFGPGGLLFFVPALPIVLFFRHLCQSDDQALFIVWLEWLCALDRRNTRAFGRTYTLSPMRYGRNYASFTATTAALRSEQRLLAALRERLRNQAPKDPS
jgi:type IV secretion system protein VirB3